MEDLWNLFCGQSSNSNSAPCIPRFMFVTHPSSCLNHAFVICCDVMLLSMLLFNMRYKSTSKGFQLPVGSRHFSYWQISSLGFNTCLGIIYIGLGIWILEENLRTTHSGSPIHWWVLYFFQGLTCLLVSFMANLKVDYFTTTSLRIIAVFAFLSATTFCLFAVFSAIMHREIIVKIALDMFSFIGASLLLLCTYKGYENDERWNIENGSTLYTSLDGDAKSDSTGNVSLFASASWFSRLTFWWLNPLMELSKENTFEEENIPKLRDLERAEVCYLRFMDTLNKQKQDDPSSKPSILWTIFACHWNELLRSGFFALLKILTLSAGPILLNAFIEVVEGNKAFEYKGFLLAISLFIAKNLESLSQRHWYFQSRLIGLKVRSMLTAVVYRKQLRLSNAARLKHSSGEIINYVIVDAYRIGEFPFWFHQTWTTSLQLCISLLILVHSVGLATISALTVIIMTVLCNTPLAKLQHKYQSKLMVAQDGRLKAFSEALVNMKVLKLYAWETHFKDVIEGLRKVESEWLSGVQWQKAYNGILFWSSPVLVSAATFGACYFLNVPLHASNVFTFVATLRLVQEPIRAIPDVINVVIQARVAFTRIVKFLEEPELQTENVKKKSTLGCLDHAILMRNANLSWEMNSSKLTLRDINLEVRPGEKVAICGEVGAGKSTILAAILGEVPYMEGRVEVYGGIAYVSQTAWIQTGTIRENILFGSAMDEHRYQECLRRCSLVKDLELLPYGDMTQIGERGVNLSGGQKQRLQLARALYQDADIYLLDDPFSAVDAHTATSLFNDYIMEALSLKTVLLVTHQVDFLPGFHSCLLMSNGEILQSGPYHELIASSKKFLDLVNAHKETTGTKRLTEVGTSKKRRNSPKEIKKADIIENQPGASKCDQLIKQEEREVGDTGLKPYLLYLNQNKGYLYLAMATFFHLIFAIGQISQNIWLASSVENSRVSTLKLIVVYLIIGASSTFFLLLRSFIAVTLGFNASNSIFSQLLTSLFCAPMSFYDSTPLGRILSRLSSDLSIVDLDVPFSLLLSIAVTMNAYANLVVLVVFTWQVLFVSIPVIYMIIQLQKYYFATAKELMRINGTTKSLVANHLAESIAGSMTIRAFEEEERFFSKNLDIIDRNASPYFHNFASNEWLMQRLETLCAIVLAAAALCMVMLPTGTFTSGFIGMALSYGLSLNMSMVFAIQNQCTLANYIICVERLNQYMHIPSEASEVIQDNRLPQNWPSSGKVEICNLKIRYRPDTPLVLKGISCTFEGGDKIGIVGRTGSGKTTLIGALFRLIEPVEGKITIDGIDICSIGLHDLRSHLGIIPQDPTLFNGTVRLNLDPLCQHKDEQLWEVLKKCQLKEAVQEKEQGLDSLVIEDGSNWSMGQRQLFCLGRALLRRSKVLVLDEATASIDNATDMILQRTIRTEFADCTVITVAHRIPTVMDCTKVLSICDGKLVEYDDPIKLMKMEGSLFGTLVKEYWSHFNFADQSY
ncbi:unnamed protein product [Amaranthus hypochondriacus]